MPLQQFFEQKEQHLRRTYSIEKSKGIICKNLELAYKKGKQLQCNH